MHRKEDNFRNEPEADEVRVHSSGNLIFHFTKARGTFLDVEVDVVSARVQASPLHHAACQAVRLHIFDGNVQGARGIHGRVLGTLPHGDRREAPVAPVAPGTPTPEAFSSRTGCD